MRLFSCVRLLRPDVIQGGVPESLVVPGSELFMMSHDTEDQRRDLDLAQARSQAGQMRAVLHAHRAPGVPRGQHWKVKEARYLQQLEVVQSQIVSLTQPLREAPSRGLAPIAKRLERAVRTRLSRLLTSRRTRTAEKPSHARGRG